LINHENNQRELLEINEDGQIKTAAISEAYWIDSSNGNKYSVTGENHSNWIKDPKNAKKVKLPDDVFEEISKLSFPKDDDKIRLLTIKNSNLIRMRQHGNGMTFEFSDSRPVNTLWTIEEFLDRMAGPFTNLLIVNHSPSGSKQYQGNFQEFQKQMEEDPKSIFSRNLVSI
jgi:hypothetical protein